MTKAASSTPRDKFAIGGPRRTQPPLRPKRRFSGAQYSSYEPVPGTHINGGLTMGENIADLGGLNVALEAYHRSLNGKPAAVIDGFTGDQRVLLGLGAGLARQSS